MWENVIDYITQTSGLELLNINTTQSFRNTHTTHIGTAMVYFIVLNPIINDGGPRYSSIHSHTLTLKHSLSLKNSHVLTFTHTHVHSQSHFHILTFTQFYPQSHSSTHSLPLTHLFSHSHTYLNSLTFTFTHSL